MRAITIATAGPPDVLEWREVPDAQPGPGEVLVDVVAAAVNRADLLQRQGLYPPPPGASTYLGLECSGRIAMLGPDLPSGHDWQVGDEVCALLAGGGYAERVAVPVGQLLPVPRGVGLVEAAALPEACCTVWSNVFMMAAMRQGETLLVHGGASGIGTMAIQLARAYPAQIIATVGSPLKAQRCLELGADLAINYSEDDFVPVVQQATSGLGVHVILDNMGAEYFARNIEVLAFNGRLVVIGLQGGTRTELDLRALMHKRGAILSSALRARPVEEKAVIVQSVRESVWPLLESGTVRPVVDRVLPMSAAAIAHRAVEAGEHVGKVVLAVR